VYATVAAVFVLQFVAYVAVLLVLRVVGEPIRLEGSCWRSRCG